MKCLALKSVLCAAALTLLPGLSLAKTTALVIGNDDYTYLEKLDVAVADAKSHCAHLKEVRKFDHVACHFNVTKSEMDRAVLKFLRELEPNDTAMVVYAGHGVQLNANDPDSVFLLPVDLDKSLIEEGAEDWTLRQMATQFNELRDAVRRQNVRLAVYVMDNCRDNPLFSSGTRTLAPLSGLGTVPADQGEFIFFSASEGEAANDRLREGDTNSPFTSVFLNAFAPNVPLVSVANTVEREVLSLTRSAGRTPQRPRYDDNVAGPGCIEGEGLCTPENRVTSYDKQVEDALESLSYSALITVRKKAPEHDRIEEVREAIAIHHAIDRQQVVLDFDSLTDLYGKLQRHPRREEVRELIRRSILLKSCFELQRFGWACPQMDDPSSRKPAAEDTEVAVAEPEPAPAPAPKAEAEPEAEPAPSGVLEPVKEAQAPEAEPAAPAKETETAQAAPEPETEFQKLAADIDVASLGNFALPLQSVQEALRALGYLRGNADGKYGPKTGKAIADWRKAVGSPETARDLQNIEPLVLLQQAAEDSASSMALLGLFHAQGLGFEKDPTVGKFLLEQAAANGFPQAKEWLAQLDKL